MKILTIAAIIIILSFVLAGIFYQYLPDKIMSHWNSKGEADGYMTKLWGLFLIPIISIAIFILFCLIPKIDPLKNNIQKFRKHYNLFILLFVIFMFYIESIIIIANIGYNINMNILIMPAIGILIFFIGFILEKAKRNWFIGIRTPWTLSSDKVWDETHKLGSRLFKLSGILAIIGVFFGKFGFLFVLIPIMISTIFLLIYSYLLYRKVNK